MSQFNNYNGDGGDGGDDELYGVVGGGKDDGNDDDDEDYFTKNKSSRKPKIRISNENAIADEDDILADEEASDNDALASDDEDALASDDDNSDNDSIKEAAITEPKTALPRFNDLDDMSGDDENSDDEDDENYLQKFDEHTKQNIIADYHPEMQAHNYDEIDIMTHVVRNDLGVIIDPLHRTLPFITKYEKARILGERAKQINSGAKIFVQVEPSVIDGYLIALKEFEQKKIPFILKRPLPNGGCEYWRFSDLEIL